MNVAKRFYSKLKPIDSMVGGVLLLLGGCFVAGTVNSIGQSFDAYCMWVIIGLVFIVHLGFSVAYTENECGK
jgi:hypothetical protein